jgi:hypothetical protein
VAVVGSLGLISLSGTDSVRGTKAEAAALRGQVDALKESVGALTGAVSQFVSAASARSVSDGAARHAAQAPATAPPTVFTLAALPASNWQSAPAAPTGEVASWLSSCKV